MGGIRIAFRGLYHGSGTSSSLIALATAFSELKGLKCCILSAGRTKREPGDLIMAGGAPDMAGNDIGLEALVRHFKAGILEPDNIHNCSVSVTDSLSLIPGPFGKPEEGRSIPPGISRFILRKLSMVYDLVLIDMGAGSSETARLVTEDSDLEVICLKQGRQLKGEFLPASSQTECGRAYYLLTDYDPDSRYSIRNMRHIYSRLGRHNSGFIPHNCGFMDAAGEGRIISYMLEGLGGPKCPDTYFFKAVADTAEAICRIVKI